ncbi:MULTISPECIES: hypothetical protein [Brevibacillus]|nr:MULTISPECIES: hypothetical protein [Brevibacillus]MED1791012.1 hypothetical protein [Brevibacillus laterosporus]
MGNGSIGFILALVALTFWFYSQDEIKKLEKRVQDLENKQNKE